MRRRSVLLGAVMVAGLAVPVGPAGAAPTRIPPSPKPFCASMNHFLGFMRSAPRPSSLRKPAGQKLMEQLRATAPRSVAGSAKTLTRSLEHVAKHGKHSLSPRATRAANASLLAAAKYAVGHCTDTGEIRAYAQLVANANASVAVRAAESSLRIGLTNAKVIYTDTDSYLGVTVQALRDGEPTLDFTDGP